MPCTEDNYVHLFETVKLICPSASSSTFLCVIPEYIFWHLQS
jgi:hypothetical protein